MKPFALLLSLALLAGCASGTTNAAKDDDCPSERPRLGADGTVPQGYARVVNHACPIEPDDELPDNLAEVAHTVQYKGMSVGFCCGGCPKEWAKLTDAQRDAKLAQVR